ncbi:MAG: feruloyl-CoA synthase [Burkholderiales bacterium]
MNQNTNNSIRLRKISLAPRETIARYGEDGVVYLTSPQALGPYPRAITERLAHWAAHAPERVLVAERDANDNWRELRFGVAYRRACRIAQGLLNRGLGVERPVAILSENSVDQALLGLASMHVGIPFAPISPAYSLVSTDFGKLKFALSLLKPGLVYVADGVRFAKAIAAALPPGCELVVSQNPAPGQNATLFDALESAVTEDVARAHAAIGPDTIAKFLFTSGSTGNPKAVINTQRMLCCNQQMILQALPFLGEAPPVLIEWSPWHHTAAGNHQFGLVLYNGGSYYIDDGRPVPGLIEKTVRNLRDIAPTFYFNVPKGFEELLPWLRREPALRDKFFSRLSAMLYAGAGMSQHIWSGLAQIAHETCGERILIISGLGSTETAPSALYGNWDTGQSGVVGLPLPGVETKLIPNGDKTEIRFRGPSITPGYWRQDELTRAAFDEEGFYKIGDAVKFVDAADPQQGLIFDGRVAEDFKLASATWVDVAGLRAKLILRGAPFIQDVVIAGHDRDFIGALIFPHVNVCRELCKDVASDASATQVLVHEAVRKHFIELLAQLRSESTGSSNRIVRALLLDAPPSIDKGEMTDKGSINQRAVLTHRAHLVETLYAEKGPGSIILDAA